VDRWMERADWLDANAGALTDEEYAERGARLERDLREIRAFTERGLLMCNGCEARTTPAVKAKWPKGRCPDCRPAEVTP
jgi:hypothetical protein